VMEVNYEHAAEVDKIRKALDARGYHDYSVQNFGSSRDVLIRMPLKPGQNSADLSKAVMRASPPTTRRRSCGAWNSSALRSGASSPRTARSPSSSLRSASSLSRPALRMEIRRGGDHRQPPRRGDHLAFSPCSSGNSRCGAPAVLAVLGYSVNESVVIADRIRENFRKMRKATVTRSSTTPSPGRFPAPSSPRLHPDDGHLDAGIRRARPSLLRARLDDRILFGIYSSVLVMAPLVRWLGIQREDLVKRFRKEARGRGLARPRHNGSRARLWNKPPPQTVMPPMRANAATMTPLIPTRTTPDEESRMKKRIFWPDLPWALGAGYTLPAFSQAKPEVLVKYSASPAMTLQASTSARWPAWPGQGPYNAKWLPAMQPISTCSTRCRGTASPKAPKDLKDVKTAALAGDLERAGQVQGSAGATPERSLKLVSVSRSGDEAP